jgi:beta-lactamase regulating signal transducer with metallopeptidase domain
MHLLSQLISFAGQAFFSGLWQGTVLVFGVGLVLRLQPRIGPSMRFVVWTCAFALTAALPLLNSHRNAHHFVAAASVPATLHVAPILALVVTGIWLLLSALRLARLAYQALRIRRIWSAATPVAVEAETQAILQTLGRRAALCISQDIDSPCAIGFFAPRLLVPASLMPKLCPAELHQIVLHECTHLHRYDDWINLAQKLGLALFPLNPALLWVDRRLGLERELACDAAVVARTLAPFDYAHCLTRLAEHRICGRRLALALSAWGRQSELLQRVQQLLRPASPVSTFQARSTFALMGFALIAGSVAMVRVPRLVSFSSPVATPVAALSAAPLRNGGGIVPVVYRESTPAQTTLLKYNAAPERTRPAGIKVPTPRHPATAPHAAEFVRTSATGRSTHMIFRNAQTDRQLRPVYLISVELSPSYAALPYGNGWLILQL